MAVNRKYIKKQLRTYQQLMGLSHWTINVKFTCEDGNYAECAADPEYLTAVIHFNLDETGSKKEVKKTIVHELAHVVLSPMTHPLRKAMPTKQLKKLVSCLEHYVITAIQNWPLWGNL